MIWETKDGDWAWECITCHSSAWGVNRDDAAYLLGWHSQWARHPSISGGVKVVVGG